MTFVPSKNPRKQQTQTPADSEQQTDKQTNKQTNSSTGICYSYWTTGLKLPGTSRMATLVPRASLLGMRLLCNNKNLKMHHGHGACWFTIAASRSLFFLRKSRESKTKREFYVICYVINSS